MGIESHYDKSFSRYTLAPAVTFPYDLVETLIGTFGGALQRLQGREMWLDEKMTTKATHRIFCPSSTTILYTDKIKIDTRTFHVRDIDAVELKTGHHKEILVEEIV